MVGPVTIILNATLLPGGHINAVRSASKPGGVFMVVIGTTNDPLIPRATYY